MDGPAPTSQSTPPLKHTPHTLRGHLRIITLACAFWAVWNYFVAGGIRVRFAASMGMSEFGFGLMGAIPHAALLIQVFSSYLMERYGHRREIFLFAGITHRAMWLLIAAIPWVAPVDAQWWLLLLILWLSSALANLSDPAWLVWMADFVPDRLRGRYFARRGQVGRFVGITATLIVGYILDRAAAIDSTTFQRIISVLFMIAAVAGVVDIALFKWIPDEHRRDHRQPINFIAMLTQPFKHPAFRRFLGFRAVLFFGIGYIEVFAWKYLFDVVKMDNVEAHIMLQAIPMVATMLTFPIWGKLVDRLGNRPVLLIAGVMITHGALSWAFVTHDGWRGSQWWIGYMAVLSATMAWPGVELASQNMLLSMADTDTNKTGGSAYVAVHNVVIGTAGMLSGIFAGIFAEHMQHWTGSFMGFNFTYHGLLFFISAALRLMSLIWLIGMPEPQSYTARAALRYMLSNIYANVQTVFVTGWRGLDSVKRWFGKR